MRGLALEGGGARGSFQVGAIKALKELGIEFDAITGTSVGAINGALIVMDDLERMQAIWEGAEMADMVNGDSEVIQEIVSFEFKSDIQKLREVILNTFKQGGFDVTPFRMRLRDSIDESVIRNSKVDYGLVTLSLTDLKPIEIFIKDIPEGKLHDYILASSNYPAFKDEKFDNKKMIDGAFFDNLPVNMLIERGCDEVIAVRLNSLGRIRKPPKDTKAKIIMIEPSEDLGRTLDVDPKRAKHNMKLGYFDTMRVMKELKGNRYYIEDLPEEQRLTDQMARMPEETARKIAEIIKSEKPHKRMIFEDLLPLLADLVKADKGHTYGELVLNFYEHLAELLEIDRFEIFTFEVFLDRVRKEFLNSSTLMKDSDEFGKHLINLIPLKGMGLLPQKTKDHLLIQIYRVLFQKGFWAPSTESTENMV
ncbi:patatin-like phospholipase family protein [Fusibacter tunisiensis]|uniref:NTE family protein n=1 Tax=Fusibacter tunisiensis TaxID=1008308 RepID=A0ABS2MPH7_9FIRM|nr:patatin-like phospholipase family protein [Fusibacter tunisiensis]MBM7561311.1 NTE family protein [Fusibacter tunisiensis]